MPCLRKRKTKRKKKMSNLASPFFGYTIFFGRALFSGGVHGKIVLCSF